MSTPTMVPCPVCSAPGPIDIGHCLLCGAKRASGDVPALVPLPSDVNTQPIEAPPVFVAPKPSGAVVGNVATRSENQHRDDDDGESTTKNERPDAQASREGGLEPGRMILNKYRIVRTLGHGGMGSVYLGHDDVTGQDVAIKALPPALAREKGIRDRFTQEAKSLARLDHPNIVGLIGFASDGDGHFLVMKFVEGPNLDAAIEARGPLPFDDVRHIFRAIVSALGHAHEKTVIHRDVKPANVLLATDGRVFLVDFGISKGDENVKLTQTGMLMGTPQYMSPEQVSGHDVDQRSDLYAAGLVLFEMLCGRPPFVGERTFSVLKQHVEAPVPDPEEIRKEPIPIDILVVLKRLLAKSPDDRPASAEATLALLDAGIQERPSFGPVPVESTPPQPSETPATTVMGHAAAVDDDDDLFPSGRPRRWPLVLAASVALLASVGASSFFLGRTTNDRGETPVPIVEVAPESATTVMLRQAEKLLSEGDASAALGVLGGIPESDANSLDVVLMALDANLAAGRRKTARTLFDDLGKRTDLDDASRATLAEKLAPRETRLNDLDAAAIARAEQRRRRADPAPKPTIDVPEGLTTKQILAVTHGGKSTRRLQDCWERTVLRQNPTARGVLRVEVHVKTNGRVSSVKVTEQTVGGPDFATCVTKAAKGWSFPAFASGEEIIGSEFQFVPTRG